ncbi:TPA: hypothetical protein ACH3X1_004896 [Trebouxia sp. C0004]
MQDQDLADQETRKKELNVVLRNVEQDETPDSLKESAKRLQKGRSNAAQGIVIVHFEKKQHKIMVFKARGTTIGLDDALTILQQQRKNAAWPAFDNFRSRGVKTQWRAEKTFVKEGDHFVEHKVLNLQETRGQLGVLSCVLLNIRGGVNKQAESFAHPSCHGFICLTETWLTEDERPVALPEHEYYSACKPVRHGKGCH